MSKVSAKGTRLPYSQAELPHQEPITSYGLLGTIAIMEYSDMSPWKYVRLYFIIA